MSSQKLRSGWFRWAVGSIIALIGAGGGLVVFLQYLDAKQEKRDRAYRVALKVWEDFAPNSLSRGPQTTDETWRECVGRKAETGLA